MEQKVTIGLIGVGLIGGSLALSLRKNKYPATFIGCRFDEEESAVALQCGIVDEIADFRTLCRKSDVIILAVPVTTIVELLPKVLDLIPENAFVVDVGSTKDSICRAVSDHPKRRQFVAAHPIAGTENSGPANAFDTLFEGKLNILCDTSESESRFVSKAKNLFQCAGMRSLEMTSSEHDLHLAYVSHLPHVLAYALGITVLDKEENQQNILNLAGSGFESAIRLAKSSPDMWTPIFMENKAPVLAAINSYIGNLELIRDSIERSDSEQTASLIQKANMIRRVFSKKEPLNVTMN